MTLLLVWCGFGVLYWVICTLISVYGFKHNYRDSTLVDWIKGFLMFVVFSLFALVFWMAINWNERPK